MVESLKSENAAQVLAHDDWTCTLLVDDSALCWGDSNNDQACCDSDTQVSKSINNKNVAKIGNTEHSNGLLSTGKEVGDAEIF